MTTSNTTTPQKHCPKCGQDKPATSDYFSRTKKAPDGLNWWCKACLADYQRQYRKTAHGKEKLHGYNNNPERQVYMHQYIQTRMQDVMYREGLRVQTHNTRARKLALPDTYTLEHWILCLDYWHNCCAVCGNQLKGLFGDIKISADHWIAMSDKNCPGTTPGNMICLCMSCNNSKKSKTPELWLKKRFGGHRAKIILNRVHSYFEWIIKQEVR